jgi:peptidoglycan/xylan/chitin deacetylase (PgdA/CDA1 family)
MDLPTAYPRDMAGYGPTPPAARWPGNARLALNFVVNYEEGGENCILHGDPASEAYLTEIVGTLPQPGRRNLTIESLYEFGSRVGVWRLLSLFAAHRLPFTAFAVGMALERNPEVARRMFAERGTRSPATAGAGSTTRTSTRRPSAPICSAPSASSAT